MTRRYHFLSVLFLLVGTGWCGLVVCRSKPPVRTSRADSPIKQTPAQTDSIRTDSARTPLVLPLSDPKIVVSKSRRELILHSGGKVVRLYRVGLGLNPKDDKTRRGDNCTPEGTFYVCAKNPNSSYTVSLLLSYPNQEDAERGLREGLVSASQVHRIVSAIENRQTPLQNTLLGGAICIHGCGSGSDWTWGCVALDDPDIRELYRAVPLGTPVIIEH